MKLQDFNRIYELSGLLEDVNKIKSIITTKVRLPEFIANTITAITEKKQFALWIANELRKEVEKDASYDTPLGNAIRLYGRRRGWNIPKATMRFPIEITVPQLTIDDTTRNIENSEDLNKFITIYIDYILNAEQAIEWGAVSPFYALNGIRDWLSYYAQPGRTNINIKDYNIQTATVAAEEWHKKLEAGKLEKTPEQVNAERNIAIVKFNDGSYWIDLKTRHSDEECEMMGHCGDTSANTIISYRDALGQAHFTMAYNYGEKELESTDPDVQMSWEKTTEGGDYRQLKGKNNAKPSPKYYDKILALFKKLQIKGYDSEYNPINDFKPLEDLPEEKLWQFKTDNEKFYMDSLKDLLRSPLQVLKGTEVRNRLYGYDFRISDYDELKDGFKLYVDDLWRNIPLKFNIYVEPYRMDFEETDEEFPLDIDEYTDVYQKKDSILKPIIDNLKVRQ